MSSPIGNVQPHFPEHKRHEVHIFDENVQQLNTITPETFLECLGGGDSNDLLPSETPNSPEGLSNEGFLSLANDISNQTRPVQDSQALAITSQQLRDILKRETEAKRRRLNNNQYRCVR